MPFANVDLTTRIIAARAIQSDVQNLLNTTLATVAGTPFKQSDYQNPLGRIQPTITDYPNLLTGTLFTPAVVAPFSQSDWVVPIGKRGNQDFSAAPSLPALTFVAPPFVQQDWQNPWGAKPGQDFVVSLPLSIATFVAPSIPPSQSDWPNPIGYQPLNVGYTFTPYIEFIPPPLPPTPTASTGGATNYWGRNKYGTLPPKLKLPNKEQDWTKAVARALEQELRIKAEKAHAERELAKVKQALADQPKPQNSVSRTATKSSNSAYVAYRTDLYARIRAYDAELDSLRKEEIGIRLRAIHAERIEAAKQRDEQDMQDILTILMLDEI
jgi:hypothetical protein